MISRLATIGLAIAWLAAGWLQPLPAEEAASPDAVRAARYAATGCPGNIAWYAAPSITRHYGSYYVGGGSLILDEPRAPQEGTWGWDYSGILFPKQIALGWTHGRRYQGGTGAYRTVGPAPHRTQ